MSTISNKFAMPQRFVRKEPDYRVLFDDLANDYKALNLGLGFPNFAPPEFLREALNVVCNSEDPLVHQYTEKFGHPRLVKSLSKCYSRLIGREIDPFTEIIVTHGGGEALFCCTEGHLSKGDEVIIIEPYFNKYQYLVKATGATTRYIPLKLRETFDNPTSADWVLDTKELEELFNEKTKAIILNTPNNPLGKVFSAEELTVIANLCKKWDVLCISDEVYEWLVCKPNKHVRICTFPGMWERTITIGSAGKAFSATGWKIGWAYGPANLIFNLQIAHENSLQTLLTPLQEALAISIEKELEHFGQDESHFVRIAKDVEQKRDFIIKALRIAGLVPIVPQGGYFIVCDWSSFAKLVDLDSESDLYRDFHFIRWMIKNMGIQAFPCSPFCSPDHKYLMENYVRICFLKKQELLEKAAESLKKWAVSNQK